MLIKRCLNFVRLITTIPTISAKTVKDYGCQGMFMDCNKLKTASSSNFKPTTANRYSFYHMFDGCIALTTAPNIVATGTSVAYCCQYMFRGCRSLVTAPTINATLCGQGAIYCFSNMFADCSKLNSIPFASTTIKGAMCTFYSMFKGCAALAQNFSSYTLSLSGDSCANSMFYGCTNLTKAPKLTFPDGQVYGGSCANMFYKCTSLKSVPFDLTANPTTGGDCYVSMFYNCSSLVVAPKITVGDTSGSVLTENMFNGCSKLQHITLDVRNNYADDWLVPFASSVPSIGTMLIYPIELDANNTLYWIPSGWKVFDEVSGRDTLVIYTSSSTTSNPAFVIVFDQGMTWSEWVNSEYNIYNARVFTSGSGGVAITQLGGSEYQICQSGAVSSSAVIDKSKHYYIEILMD